jgi:hypothetical protein
MTAPKPQFRAKALYSYEVNPDDSGEMSFSKGELFIISDITGPWWNAKNKRERRAGNCTIKSFQAVKLYHQKAKDKFAMCCTMNTIAIP